jgi:hypothetical protein
MRYSGDLIATQLFSAFKDYYTFGLTIVFNL